MYIFLLYIVSSHHHLILFHLNVLNHHISSLHFFSAHSSSVTSLFFPSICSLPPTCFRATLSSSFSSSFGGLVSPFQALPRLLCPGCVPSPAAESPAWRCDHCVMPTTREATWRTAPSMSLRRTIEVAWSVGLSEEQRVFRVEGLIMPRCFHQFTHQGAWASLGMFSPIPLILIAKATQRSGAMTMRCCSAAP